MSVTELLKQSDRAELLRLLTCGSVDDGKSTLIGRLLYDSKTIYEDTLKTLEKDSARVGSAGSEIDYSLLLDGLKAEREQGITIDVAYRYFSTPRRKFIIADCPGHVQYTRNMATGASTAQLAIVLIDARKGVLEQTRRHSFIASLLDIGQVVVAVNKMDLVDFSQKVFEDIRADYTEFTTRLAPRNVTFIPLSALRGDNVVEAGTSMPWYKGAPLLEYLETVHIASGRNLIDMRFPVQYVQRRDMSFRGYSGTVASGILRQGTDVTILPSGKKSRITGIHTFEGTVEEAFAPMAVTVTLADEIDVGRGDMLVSAHNQPRIGTEIDAVLVWMNESALDTGRTYRLKQTSAETQAVIRDIRYRFNIQTLHREEATSLQLNEIGRVTVETSRPLAFDPYRRNRATGSFILIDSQTNATVAAGMILDHGAIDTEQPGVGVKHLAHNIRQQKSRVTSLEKQKALGQKPVTIWLTGLPKAGKTTIAYALERVLFDRGRNSHVLDGENLRYGLSQNLAFSPTERTEHVRRAAHTAKLFNDAGLIAIVALVSPATADREMAQDIIGREAFLEVFVDAPVEVCESRDEEGLYAKAKSGAITHFTGVSAPYEVPKNPLARIDTQTTSPESAADELLALLARLAVF